MPRFMGFCGGTDQTESVNVNASRSVNLYPERNAQGSVGPISLYQRAGKTQFADLEPGPVGGLFKYLPSGASLERVFAVASNFSEIYSDGTHHDYTFVATSLPVTMAANNANQIVICTGGNLWCFNTLTNTATQVATNLGVAFASVGFLGGFFLALQLNSQTVWYSNSEDGTTWQGLNFFAVSLFADNVLSMIMDHGLIWLHGPKLCAVYYETTDPLNPFLPSTTQTIQQGTAAPFSIVTIDNTVLWIGADDRGDGIAWRANGYTPSRVSTFAVEYAWAQYSTIKDAIGYTYQENGHQFWVIYFPTANKTWAYDAATGLWHERMFWTGSAEVADRARCHVKAFGKHLLGDTQSGKVWQASTNIYQDFGNPIVRYRRSPHANEERRRITVNAMQVDMESGLGPSVAIPTLPTGPNAIILQDTSGQRWSVTLNGSFILQSTAVGSGTVMSVFLQDTSNPTVNWQLGVNTSGLLTATVTTTLGQPAYLMVTTTNVQAQLSISNGFLQSGPGALAQQYRGPYVYLRWSKDGGHTWGSQQLRDAGQLGEYKKRVFWRRLGIARDWVFEVGTSENFSCRIVDAYMNPDPSRI